MSSAPVRVLKDQLEGLLASGLVDAHRLGRIDTVGLEKHHDLVHHLLLGPRLGHLFLMLGSDVFERQQPMGIGNKNSLSL